MSLKGKIKDIADSLRETLGTNVKYTLSQMPPLIRSLNFKYKTDDIYYNFFKFDCSKYGDALIFNSHLNFRSENTNTENRYKRQLLITGRGNNSHYYYDNETEFKDSLHSIFPVNPDVYEYQYGDTYYNFSSNTFEYEYYPTFHFCNYNKTSEPFDKIILKQHFLINFKDSEKTYSVGLGITSNSPYDDRSYYSKTKTSYSNYYYSKFFWLSVEASKLYVTSGINEKSAETFKDYICDLEPETDLDITVELDYTDEDLTNNNFSNIFNYKITVNSTEYTGTLTHTWTDSFLQGNLTYNNRPFGIATLKDTPEKLWWYSMEMKGRRFTNVLINPIVSFAEGRLFEITDENSPGLKNIHAKCINLCTNPAFKTLDNSSVEIVEPYAFQAETTSDYTFYMQLEKINLPACKTIGNYAFGGLSNRWSTIAELNIPNVETIGTGAFQYSLRKMHGTLALNKVTSIASSAFAQAGFSKISLPLITALGTNTFENCQNLEEIDMPLLETIGNYCFSACHALRKINMPNLKTAGNYSFAYKRCHYTTEDFYFPNLETLGAYVFAYSNFGPHGKINFLPNVKKMGSDVFHGCTCEEIELPELLNPSGYASFQNIKNLKKLRLPKVNGKYGYFFKWITYKSDDYTFDLDLIAPNLSYYCYSMFEGAFFAIFKSSYLTIPDGPYYGIFNNSWVTQAYIKNLNYINDRFFYHAYNLEIAYFDSAYTIGRTNYYAEHFRECCNLKALILAGDETVCSLIDKNAFYQTPMAPLENQRVANNIKQKREGYIYVPRALLESYKTTINWSYYADSFRAIEDYGGLEGIKKLIHPDYANTVNLTNSQLVSDIQNPLRSKVLSTELDVAISNTVNDVDCSEFGDNNQYVVMKRLNETRYRNLVLLSLPAVKDFEVEFDMVASSYSDFPTLWFGFKKLPETVEEFTNENVCQPYTYGIHFKLGFGKTARVDNTSVSYYTDGCFFIREAGVNQLYSSDDGGFYYYEKIHIRIVRQGRVFKRYWNEILSAQAEFDEIQHCPGGFLGIELHKSTTVGITNFVLKYDNTWHDPLSNEIWISSVRLPNLTVNIDGVDEVLSKNEFDYYVFDTTNVTDSMDVKMFSDNTQISDLSTKITQFSGKILCITDNEQVTYN